MEVAWFPLNNQSCILQAVICDKLSVPEKIQRTEISIKLLKQKVYHLKKDNALWTNLGHKFLCYPDERYAKKNK